MALPMRSLGPAVVGTLLVALAPAAASAQSELFDEGIQVGDWVFQPMLELRLRGEYHRHPTTVGGEQPASTALLAHENGSNQAPHGTTAPRADDQWLLAERARLGLRVSYELVRGVLVLEDARALGFVPGSPSELDAGGFGTFAPYEAYLAVGTGMDPPARADGRDADRVDKQLGEQEQKRQALEAAYGAASPVFPEHQDWGVELRLGRQAVQWGDGRLVGCSDWALRGHSLDAVRLRARVGDFDLDSLAALLASPAPLSPEVSGDATGSPTEAGWGTGAQLYGLDATWRALPLLRIELTALARIVREPVPTELTPSDVVALGGRVFGEELGFRYAAEGVYELGRVASYGTIRELSAFAVAARASLLTSLPWSFEFGLRGAYASGQDPDEAADGTVGRFDPLVPELHEGRGLMELQAWSNAIEAGAFVAATPFDEGRLRVGFDFHGLANPADRWTSASLCPVGAAPDNESHILGYEIQAAFGVTPWEPLDFEAGYGLLVLGRGGRAVLGAAGRGERDVAQLAYLQAKLAAP